MAQEEINRRVYQRPELVRLYGTRAELLPSESSVLVRYRDDVIARPVLDLGCGGGRLAAHFQLLTPHYEGIDISPYMIAHCRKRFPGLRFVESDMRRLAEVGDRTFSAVFAVANLIDAVDHDGRLDVLAEVHRALSPGGLFVFSTHNRNWVLAGTRPRLARSRRPLAQVRHGFEYVIHRYRHARMRRFEQLATDHAVLNDDGRGYTLLHYYITRTAQERQLEAAGFRLLETLDETGRPLGPDDDDRPWSSLLYVARSC